MKVVSGYNAMGNKTNRENTNSEQYYPYLETTEYETNENNEEIFILAKPLVLRA